MSFPSDFWGAPVGTDAAGSEPVAAPPGATASPYGYGPPPPFGPPRAPYQPPAYLAGGRADTGTRTDKREPPLAFVVGLAVVIVALIAGATVAMTRLSRPPLDGLTPAQVLNKSLTAARKAQTVHVTETDSYGDSTRQYSLDLSPNGGTDTETVDGGTAEIIEVDGRLYIEADASYWSSQYGASESFIKTYAGKWLNIPIDRPVLEQVAEVLKMPTIVDHLLALSGVISKGRPPAKDEVALTGAVPYNDFTRKASGDPATLVISSKSPFLPVSMSYGDPDNGSVTMTFSKWGVPIPLAPPPSPLSLPHGGGITA